MKTKISVVMVTYNPRGFFHRAISSFLEQSYASKELIIVDGNSAENHKNIILNYAECIDYFISEPDHGVYDALNKAIDIASGELILILHSDDFFASNSYLESYAEIYREAEPDLIVGNLKYINEAGLTTRCIKAEHLSKSYFYRGKLPPHPSIGFKKTFFKKVGDYNFERYPIIADYDWLYRALKYNPTLKVNSLANYIMQEGGNSSLSLSKLNERFFEYLRFIPQNGFIFLIAFFLKGARKFLQKMSFYKLKE